MSDTPAARRALDEVGPGPTPDPGTAPAPPPAPTWPEADDADADPVAEADRLPGDAQEALDGGVKVPDTRSKPAREALLRALQPVTSVQHRVDDHTIGSVHVLVGEARLQRARTNRLLAGMATVDLALDVVDGQVRALRDEVAALRQEVAELRAAGEPGGGTGPGPTAGDATDAP